MENPSCHPEEKEEINNKMAEMSRHDKITHLLMKREAERQNKIKTKRVEKKLLNADNEQDDIISKTFQDQISEIRNQIESLEYVEPQLLADEFNKISKMIGATQKFVSDSMLFIKGYHMRTCQGTLLELDTELQHLEEKMLPKKKFGFKPKTEKKRESNVVSIDEVDFLKTIDVTDNFGFKNISNQTLSLEKDSVAKKDIVLQCLVKCAVKIFGSPSTLHMNDLNDCVIICGPIATSVFAENCHNCKFVLACQQLRFHSSVNCDIYLHVTSRAIIEDCKKISVAPYNLTYAGLTEDFKDAGLDSSVNNWKLINDFNWLVADKASPNWSILNENNLIGDWNDYILKRI